MTRARLAKLEAQAVQQRAALEARNTERVSEALGLLSLADLHLLRAAVETCSGWTCPWDDLPPEDVRAVWTWAAVMHTRTPAQVWPLPPAGAAQVFEREAAKVEETDPARLAWLVMAKLAQVIGQPVTVGELLR